MLELQEVKDYMKNGNFRKVEFDDYHGYGIVPSEKLSTVKSSWNYLPFQQKTPWVGCYSSYLMTGTPLINKENWNYYVAYPTMPTWFPKFIDDFNNFFDNLKLEIVESKPVYIKYEKKNIKRWDGPNGEYLVMGFDQNEGHVKAIVPIVKFSYAKDYLPEIKYFFNYNMVIFVRLLSFHERFYNPFSRPRMNKVEFVVKTNNNNTNIIVTNDLKGYRLFCEKEFSLEDLKLIDDIERVNSLVDVAFEKNFSVGKAAKIKQTDFIQLLRGDLPVKNNILKLKLQKVPEVKEQKEVHTEELIGENFNIRYKKMPAGLTLDERKAWVAKEYYYVYNCPCKQCTELRIKYNI